ncbi:MAG TPA: PP0621 family protein [Rhizobacter sp.]
MKYILLLAVVIGVIWLMRTLRRPERPSQEEPKAPGNPTAPSTEAMVSCEQCGVHLPRSEALPGRGGVFCSEAHRRAFESQRSG